MPCGNRGHKRCPDEPHGGTASAGGFLHFRRAAGYIHFFRHGPENKGNRHGGRRFGVSGVNGDYRSLARRLGREDGRLTSFGRQQSKLDPAYKDADATHKHARKQGQAPSAPFDDLNLRLV